jgi:hypothetical protein
VVPAELEAIAQRLLQKDPDERYANGRALIVALDAVIRDLEERAKPAAGGLDRARSRPQLAMAVLGAVILVAAVLWLVLSRR